MRKLATILLAFFSAPVFAGYDTYTCVVKDIVKVADNGLFEKSKNVYSYNTATIFIINKRTGEVVGDGINSNGMVSEVLDKGGSDNNYKSLSQKLHDPTYREVLYIEVMDATSHKAYPIPFIGYRFSTSFSGVCK